MRKPIMLLLILVSGLITPYAHEPGTGKILIAYFSWARNKDLSGDVDTSTHASVQLSDGVYKGDVEIVAGWIGQETGGDIFSIETASLYPESFRKTVDRGGREQRQDARPELSANLSHLAEYKIIFLGYPVWWRDVPMALYTFMDSYNFSGKILVPFATHMGGGLGSSVKTIRRLEPEATVLEPFALSDYSLMDSQKSAKAWLFDVLGY